jgi:hypothetical protein
MGTLAAADEVDRAIQRSCIGRIVGLLALIFIALCIGLWILLFVGLQAGSLGERFSVTISAPALAIAFFGGLLFCIVLARLIGRWLRRRIWRTLRQREDRHGF